MKFDSIWYGKHPLRLALAPLSWLFCAIVKVRQRAYRHGLLTRQKFPIPVIIAGNITVGVTGKTPLVIWLGQFLKKQGFKPGIVSRGYGGRAEKWPQRVYPDSEPTIVGDEALLLARHSGCPVVVAPKRIKAVQTLLENHDCDLIISDDGLQHYALHRDIEIAVLDDIRRYGNKRCLPAGPLREPMTRLKKIDFTVTKGAALNQEFSMQYDLKALQHVIDDNVSQPLAALRGQTVHAVAGIGHPAKFFTRLRDNGLKLRCHEFPDHHYYSQTEIHFNDDKPVIMTEKDAVKCRHFAGPQHWYLPIEARLPNLFGERLLHKLKGIQKNGSKTI
jgi:tetraacyldisaccharide 4'-kinase